MLEYYRPRHYLGEKLLKYLADEEWEVGRYKRHKIFLIERRFHARVVFQACREKTAQEDKAALAKRLAEQRPSHLVLPEEVLDGLIAEVDAMLLRPAAELDHARALEVGIVYFQHLDRLLHAAIARRNAILADIERYDHLFDPAPLTPSVVTEEPRQSADAVGCEVQASEAHVRPMGQTAPPLVTAQEG